MNSSLVKFLTNGGLTKFLSIIFLFCLATSALAVAGIEVLHGEAINPYVISILTIAAGTASTIVGIHMGTDLAAHTSPPPGP